MVAQITRREAEDIIRTICIKIVKTEGVGTEHAFIDVPKGCILYIKQLSKYVGLEKTEWELRLSPTINPSSGWNDAELIGSGPNLPKLLSTLLPKKETQKNAKEVSVEAEDGSFIVISMHQLARLYSAIEAGRLPKKLRVKHIPVGTTQAVVKNAIITLGTNGLELRIPIDRENYSVVLIEDLLNLGQEATL
jgi:hypothetical protein